MTHQIVRPFRSMSVLDNDRARRRAQVHRRSAGAHVANHRQAEDVRAREILRRSVLPERRQARRSFPLGQLKRLESRVRSPSIRRSCARRAAGRPQPRGGCEQIDMMVREWDGVTTFSIEHNLEEVSACAAVSWCSMTAGSSRRTAKRRDAGKTMCAQPISVRGGRSMLRVEGLSLWLRADPCRLDV